MSLKKRDSSTSGGLRVAANDPHLVSLGGGRLSTAVTIHYIPIGDTTIGSSPCCKISLNGGGIQPLHCTIYRSENGEVTIVPEKDARVLIDGNKVLIEANLTQGAMLTIGNSNYLRFNNPAEAQLIRSAIGSNERISMPQIDFTQDESLSEKTTEIANDLMYNSFHEALEATANTLKKQNKESNLIEKMSKTTEFINLNNFHSPKVFTADSITVNAPAKDVLGSKYANFAKNLVENHRNIEKNNVQSSKNNEIQSSNLRTGNSVNIPPSFIQNSPNQHNDVLVKINNNIRNASNSDSNSQPNLNNLYERYPKPGSYGELQLFPMNGVNSEINNSSRTWTVTDHGNKNNLQSLQAQQQDEQRISAQEQERLDEILKICTEYERQQSQQQQINPPASATLPTQSSPIVQNRIKTNGSLPRDKKLPYYHDLSPQSSPNFFNHSKMTPNFPLDKPPVPTSVNRTNSGYENVRLSSDNKIEIGGCATQHKISSTGYENVMIAAGKSVPQSPRTKIRTICSSPKKDFNPVASSNSSVHNGPQNQADYSKLIQSFEDKLKMEVEAIREKQRESYSTLDSSRSLPRNVPARKSMRNGEIKESTENVNKSQSESNKTKNKPISQSSNTEEVQKEHEKSEKLSASLKENFNSIANVDNLEKLKTEREETLHKIRSLKAQIADIQRQEEEVLRELDMEKALVSAELSSISTTLVETEKNFSVLQAKIHRLEAQRNANRVMQETQQAKLKQAIEMKQEQTSRLIKMREENGPNESIKEELDKYTESLENDRKTFEDLEFQYLEEETEWLAYREELHSDLKQLASSIEEKRSLLLKLENQEHETQASACKDTKTLENNLLTLLTLLEKSREELKNIDRIIFENSGGKRQQEQETTRCLNQGTDSEDEDLSFSEMRDENNLKQMIISQSLFGSTELLSVVPKNSNLMSRSVNENMFFNNNIEAPGKHDILSGNALKSSTPKVQKAMAIFNISDDITKIAQNNHNDLKQTEEEYSVNENKDSLCYCPPNGSLKKNLKPFNVNENITNIVQNKHAELEKAEDLQDNYNGNLNNSNKIRTDDKVNDASNSKTKNNSKIENIKKQLFMNQEKNKTVNNVSQPAFNVSEDITSIAQRKHEFLKRTEEGNQSSSETRNVNLSLTLGNDDFEVNPLEKRVPSQDDIDRICKVTINAPISTKGASDKIFESIKEIERNRQLLLAQQGSHVIEHERQKMMELKKKSHNEAKALYLSTASNEIGTDNKRKKISTENQGKESLTRNEQQQQRRLRDNVEDESESRGIDQKRSPTASHSQQRFSQPEFESQHSPRPLSETNSEISYNPLSEKQSKSADDLLDVGAANRLSGNSSGRSGYGDSGGEALNRSSIESGNTTADDDFLSRNNSTLNSTNKRSLPKHQRPLTRYLPIFSPDLDLKLHIESAGHQLALCPHVFIDSFSCRGYLHKLGATFHAWSRRWFVFDRQRSAFVYYSDKSEKKPRGGAYFSTIEEVYLDHLNTSKSGRPHSTFIVKTKKRSYHLLAASDAATRIWIDAIITGAQGNLDYM